MFGTKNMTDFELHEKIDKFEDRVFNDEVEAKPYPFVTDSEIEDSVCDERNKLRDELEQLKAHQWQPNWDDAPKRAENAIVFVRFYDECGMCVNDSDVILLKNIKRPTPPAPVVEVGQVWEYKNCEYIVTCCGKLKQGNDWVESVTYFLGGDTYTRTLSDFLAKFERVQP